MSLTGIGSTTAPQSVSATSASSGSARGGGAVPFGLGGGAAGAYMAQPGGSGSLVKKMLVGGVVGAGVGFAASFFTLPIIGQVAAPIAAAVGAGIGALGGLAVHLIGKRRENLAMQAQAAAAQQSAMTPTPLPGAAARGGTLKVGSRGPAARALQVQLKKLGLYAGKIDGHFGATTSAAVRKYEVMKGVVPTGLGSADLRSAVAQDVTLMSRYG